MRGLTIGRTARQAGVGVETIRFYERKGLIEQPPRPAGSGVRRYPEETVERIRFIRQAQQLGFSLREIRELLALRADPKADAADVRDRATAKLADVDDKIRQLERIKEALEILIAACPGYGTLGRCSIVEALERHDTAGESGAPPSPSVEHRGDVAMQTTTLTIEGMHCDGCAERIRTVLGKEPGVRRVRVSFAEGSAQVEHNAHAIGEARLREFIERAGFRVVAPA